MSNVIKSNEQFFNENLSNGTNGWTKLPNGLILQWCRGVSTSSEGYQTVTYPIPFPTTCIYAEVNTGGANEDGMFQLASFGTSTCSIFCNTFNSGNGTIQPYVFLIGY